MTDKLKAVIIAAITLLICTHWYCQAWYRSAGIAAHHMVDQ
jgi:hypothetical protein